MIQFDFLSYNAFDLTLANAYATEERGKANTAASGTTYKSNQAEQKKEAFMVLLGEMSSVNVTYRLESQFAVSQFFSSVKAADLVYRNETITVENTYRTEVFTAYNDYCDDYWRLTGRYNDAIATINAGGTVSPTHFETSSPNQAYGQQTGGSNNTNTISNKPTEYDNPYNTGSWTDYFNPKYLGYGLVLGLNKFYNVSGYIAYDTQVSKDYYHSLDANHRGDLANGVAAGKQVSKEVTDVITTLAETGVTFTTIGAGGASATSTLPRNLNYSAKAALRLKEAGRFLPQNILKEAIQFGTKMPDPQGTSAIMHYIQISRNGKLYNLEVLYDYSTNTVWHFLYTPDPIGPLPAIPK